MLIHTHTLTQALLLPFRSALPSAFNHCCFLLLCKTLDRLPAVLPTSPLNCSALAHSVSRMGGVVWKRLICTSQGGM